MAGSGANEARAAALSNDHGANGGSDANGTSGANGAGGTNGDEPDEPDEPDERVGPPARYAPKVRRDYMRSGAIIGHDYTQPPDNEEP